MNIAWCTPFAPASAIGRFSALVVSELRSREHVDVDIWFPPGAGGRQVPDRGEVLPDDDAELILGRYDTVIYQIGDNSAYHARIVELSHVVPGIIVAHDLSLIHLMIPKLLSLPTDALLSELTRWYGAEAGATAAADIAQDSSGWAWRDETVKHFPLTEFALEDATAVITHSRFAADEMRERYSGDVYSIPLPALHFDDAELAQVPLPMLDERPVILQAGVINPNKAVHTVIEAFDLAGVADRAQLVICGYADDRILAGVHRDVVRRGLERSVRVLGPVSDATLHSLRTRALMATVLRDPCTEAASAVLLDSMAYGLGLITVETGHYSEAPDATVARVALPLTADSVAARMLAWLDDPAAARAAGSAAREYVQKVHTPGRYVDQLLDIVPRAGAYRRRRELATELAATVQRIGFGPADPITDSVAGAAVELLDSSPRNAQDLIYRR
jgi:glycosyltransferase involved in cell wall biosynthesis